MCRNVCLVLLLHLLPLLPARFVSAAVQLTVIEDPYEQDFNTLASSGSSSLLPSGWHTNQPSYVADNGSTTALGIRSYGQVGSSERALGSLSNAALLMFGVEFQNATGIAINTLDISFMGEQWQRGSNTPQVTDTLFFEYSLDALSLATGTWISMSSLNFTSPNVAGSSFLTLNGNLASNKFSLVDSITNLNIPVNTNFWIRWRDTDVTGNEHGLAVDNFQIVPRAESDFQITPLSNHALPEPTCLTTWSLLAAAAMVTNRLRRWKRRQVPDYAGGAVVRCS